MAAAAPNDSKSADAEHLASCAELGLSTGFARLPKVAQGHVKSFQLQRGAAVNTRFVRQQTFHPLTNFHQQHMAQHCWHHYAQSWYSSPVMVGRTFAGCHGFQELASLHHSEPF